MSVLDLLIVAVVVVAVLVGGVYLWHAYRPARLAAGESPPIEHPPPSPRPPRPPSAPPDAPHGP
jgi:hypothetical protein